MKNWLKIIIIIAAVGILAGGGTVYYIFNMPHRDVKNEKPAFTIEASELYSEFSNEEELANKKFGDKVLQVNGDIAEISREGFQISITLADEMEGVNCALDSMAIVENKDLIKSLKVNDNITLKGKCDGFDMIMGVVLTRCFIVK